MLLLLPGLDHPWKSKWQRASVAFLLHALHTHHAHALSSCRKHTSIMH